MGCASCGPVKLENAFLRAENRALRQENARLRREIRELKGEIRRLRALLGMVASYCSAAIVQAEGVMAGHVARGVWSYQKGAKELATVIYGLIRSQL